MGGPFHDLVSFETFIHLPRVPELSNLNITKEEVPMYDPNLKLRERTYTKNSNPTTWPDVVRQNRDSDVDLRLYKVHHENGLSLLAGGVAKGLGHFLSSLLHWLARQSRHEARGMTQKHFPVDR